MSTGIPNVDDSRVAVASAVAPARRLRQISSAVGFTRKRPLKSGRATTPPPSTANSQKSMSGNASLGEDSLGIATVLHSSGQERTAEGDASKLVLLLCVLAYVALTGAGAVGGRSRTGKQCKRGSIGSESS